MASDQEIYDTLTGTGAAAPAKKSPCGCGESSALSATEESGGLAVDLEAALDALSSSGSEFGDLDVSSLDEDLLFGGIDQEPSITLQDLVSLAEQYPGLKITISF